MIKELRPYQIQAVDDFINACKTDHTKNYIIVIPGGGGKSLIQSKIVEWIVSFPGTRVLCVTNDARIIAQNYNEFIDDTGFLDAGIYSAGLKKRDQFNRVLFAGIQSIHNKSMSIGAFDLIMVDECHGINHKDVGRYRNFLKEQKELNPNLIIGGMSATPYRMQGGLLTQGKDAIFDKICHETKITHLQDNGWLVKFVSPAHVMKSKIDVSTVKKTAGDYNKKELEQVYDITAKIKNAVTEIISLTADRKKILVFCAGIEHAEHVKNEFIRQGQTLTNVVHSKKADSADIIKKFETDQIRILCNKDMLTTGYNNPAIDCIVLLMSTMSPGKYVQMVVRGSRLCPATGKKDCLVLDFGNNIIEHGAIDKIEVFVNEKGEQELKKQPQKECPNCGIILPLQSRECPECGYIYEREIKHNERPDYTNNVISEYIRPQWQPVTNIRLYRHKGRNGKRDTLKITYYSNMIKIADDYICLEHEGYAKKMAYKILNSFGMEWLTSIDDALNYEDSFPCPSEILIDNNSKFPKILNYQFSRVEDQELVEAIPF